MSHSLPPNSHHELLTWAKANRPDMVPYLEELLEAMPHMGQKGDAMGLLIASAFTAGRWFQKTHEEQVLHGQNPYGPSEG